jgi:ABC-type antimicrobial peptide transport system ATPase subunit
MKGGSEGSGVSTLRTMVSILVTPLLGSNSVTKSLRFGGRMMRSGKVLGIPRMAVEKITSSIAEGTISS